MFFKSFVWRVVCDDADGGGTTFTPEQEALIAQRIEEATKTAKTSAQKAIDEANALKQKANLKDGDLKAFEERISVLQSEILTKEELARQEKDRIQKESETKLKAAEESSLAWQKLYAETSILNGIRAACTGDLETYNTDHVIALLKGDCRIVEELKDGKPTGNFIPKARITEKTKTGEIVELDLSISDAVKKLAERPEHFPIFKTKAVGGTGDSNVASGGKNVDIVELAKNPDAYIKAKREGKLPK